jgi:Domain of unknown function (DUF5069)
MTKVFPRSPYEKLGGYVHLPRLIDKARLKAQDLLNGYNYKTVGFDRHLLTFLNVDGDRFEEVVRAAVNDLIVLRWVQQNGRAHTLTEIAHWNDSMISRRPDTPEKVERFKRILAEVGGDEGSGVETYFDLIEFEERRSEFLARRRNQSVSSFIDR